MDRTVKQHAIYVEQRLAYKDTFRFVDVEAAIDWAVATRPDIFPLIPGSKFIRILKTDGDEFDGAGLKRPPPFRVLFRISNDDEIELLAIQEIP
jgi:hypothetical protein